MEYWLVAASVAAFAACLAASLAWSGRATGGLEKELARLKIRMDALEARGREAADREAADQAGGSAEGREAPRPPPQIRYGNVTREVLKIVSGGPRTARQIQAELGQSREHVARTVKKMSEQGYLVRGGGRPFVYTIAPEGRRVLKGDADRGDATGA